MSYALLAALALLLLRPDPAPALWRSRERARDMECVALSAEVAQQQRPGAFAPASPRGALAERQLVQCREPYLPARLRAPADSTVLFDLSARAEEIAGAAVALRPDLAGRTWRVEAHHANAAVAEKLRFAGATALMARGLSLSDRAVYLGAGDIDVLTRLDPDEAWPIACHRYALGESEALLVLLSRDRRESAVHAGLCADARWEWLR